MSFWARIKIIIGLWWAFAKTTIQILRGVWRIQQMPQPCVSIFGGTNVALESVYAQKANTLAANLVEHNISVITGGGPGIMQAANCGAKNAQKGMPMTLGIGVKTVLQKEGGFNPCVKGVAFAVDYFYARKWLLIEYAEVFIIFPGGAGTLDEFADLLNLMLLEEIKKRPIILVGSEFWKPFIEWLAKSEKLQLVPEQTLSMLKIMDDVQEISNFILKHLQTQSFEK